MIESILFYLPYVIWYCFVALFTTGLFLIGYDAYGDNRRSFKYRQSQQQVTLFLGLGWPITLPLAILVVFAIGAEKLITSIVREFSKWRGK